MQQPKTNHITEENQEDRLEVHVQFLDDLTYAS